MFLFLFYCLLVTINKKIVSFLEKSPTLKFVIDGDSTDNPKTFIKKAAGMKEASKSKDDSDGPSCSSSTNYRKRRSQKEVGDEKQLILKLKWSENVTRTESQEKDLKLFQHSLGTLGKVVNEFTIICSSCNEKKTVQATRSSKSKVSQFKLHHYESCTKSEDKLSLKTKQEIKSKSIMEGYFKVKKQDISTEGDLQDDTCSQTIEERDSDIVQDDDLFENDNE